MKNDDGHSRLIAAYCGLPMKAEANTALPRPFPAGREIKGAEEILLNLQLVRWVAPATEDYPQFPIDGETPVVVVDEGGVAFCFDLVYKGKVRRALFLSWLPIDFVCDQASTPRGAARLSGITKSILAPQGIFHDSWYRYLMSRCSFIVLLPDDEGKRNDIVMRYASEHPRDWKDIIRLSPPGEVCVWYKPTQRQADEMFGELLLRVNYKSGVIKNKWRAHAAELAVEIAGAKSFRDPEMRKKCNAVLKQIRAWKARAQFDECAFPVRAAGEQK